MEVLNNNSTKHAITKSQPDSVEKTDSTFAIPSRYSSNFFHGIMIDTGAARWSTAGKGKFEALKRIRNTINLDTSKAGQAKIMLGIGENTCIGTTEVETPVGLITFHVVDSKTSFLCLHDIDEMKLLLDNLSNILVGKHGF